MQTSFKIFFGSSALVAASPITAYGEGTSHSYSTLTAKAVLVAVGSGSSVEQASPKLKIVSQAAGSSFEYAPVTQAAIVASATGYTSGSSFGYSASKLKIASQSYAVASGYSSPQAKAAM